MRLSNYVGRHQRRLFCLGSLCELSVMEFVLQSISAVCALTVNTVCKSKLCICMANGLCPVSCRALPVSVTCAAVGIFLESLWRGFSVVAFV